MANIITIGGDKRISYLYSLLKDSGYNVNCALSAQNPYIDYNQLQNADILILGIPASRDGINVFAPEAKYSTISLEHIIKSFGGKKIIGGMLPAIVYECKKGDIDLIDYAKLDDLMMLNAISTAEGTIDVIIKNTDTTICSSNIIVIGNGKCGKVISKMLAGLGAKVTVTARKSSDFAYIEAMGLNYCHSSNISSILSSADVIVNTVPFNLISPDDYKLIKKDAFLVDIASMPGYIDKNLCEKNSLKYEHALSLPGKTAPKSAGCAIYKAIQPYIN